MLCSHTKGEKSKWKIGVRGVCITDRLHLLPVLYVFFFLLSLSLLSHILYKPISNQSIWFGSLIHLLYEQHFSYHPFIPKFERTLFTIVNACERKLRCSHTDFHTHIHTVDEYESVQNKICEEKNQQKNQSNQSIFNRHQFDREHFSFIFFFFSFKYNVYFKHKLVLTLIHFLCSIRFNGEQKNKKVEKNAKFRRPINWKSARLKMRVSRSLL